MVPALTVSRQPRFNITSFRFETKARDAERGTPWSGDQEACMCMCRECGARVVLDQNMSVAPGHRGRWPSMTTADKLAILDWGRRPTAPPSALIFVSRVRDAENNALGSAVSRQPQFNITSFCFKTKARDAERGAPWSDDQETPSEHVPRMRSTCCARPIDERSARSTWQVAIDDYCRQARHLKSLGL